MNFILDILFCVCVGWLSCGQQFVAASLCAVPDNEKRIHSSQGEPRGANMFACQQLIASLDCCPESVLWSEPGLPPHPRLSKSGCSLLVA